LRHAYSLFISLGGTYQFICWKEMAGL
jgi:hypothetical protein